MEEVFFHITGFIQPGGFEKPGGIEELLVDEPWF